MTPIQLLSQLITTAKDSVRNGGSPARSGPRSFNAVDRLATTDDELVRDLAVDIGDALKRLSPQEQEDIRLYFVERHTVDEAAEILHISRTAFWQRLDATRAKLRGLLRELID